MKNSILVFSIIFLLLPMSLVNAQMSIQEPQFKKAQIIKITQHKNTLQASNSTLNDNSTNTDLSPMGVNNLISSNNPIPNWVKAVFGYYADGKLSDSDLIQALQFLINQGIIKIK